MYIFRWKEAEQETRREAWMMFAGGTFNKLQGLGAESMIDADAFSPPRWVSAGGLDLDLPHFDIFAGQFIAGQHLPSLSLSGDKIFSLWITSCAKARGREMTSAWYSECAVGFADVLMNMYTVQNCSGDLRFGFVKLAISNQMDLSRLELIKILIRA